METASGYSTAGKAPVIGAIARKGNVVCKMIDNTDTRTLARFVRRVVNKESVELIASDEHSGYRLLGAGPETLHHEVVRHSAGEYARGVVQTNTIEAFLIAAEARCHGPLSQHVEKYLSLYLSI